MKKGDDMTWLTQITMGSLFDGIGGFPLAAVRSGITPIWASEIEAFPIEVTKLRFPDMAHVGDITKLNGAELPPWTSSAGAAHARIMPRKWLFRSNRCKPCSTRRYQQKLRNNIIGIYRTIGLEQTR